ncbi:MAG TPA: c-type cytochrome [Polyangia bacterium]|nr:c-type cytochrome [Polyangia bacterium]
MRSIRALAALLLTIAPLAGCWRRAASAAEGATTVAVGYGGDRTVVNQPLGPVPGPGDITPVANPLGEDRVVLEEGRKLFVQFNCAGCHGGRAGGGMGPSLRDADWRYGGTPDRIFNSIAQGRGLGMPSWGARLPQDEIWQITAYISSLRTPNEPEAPR